MRSRSAARAVYRISATSPPDERFERTASKRSGKRSRAESTKSPAPASDAFSAPRFAGGGHLHHRRERLFDLIDGGDAWAVFRKHHDHAARAPPSMCATNPNDCCCYNCEQVAPEGCPSPRPDPEPRKAPSTASKKTPPIFATIGASNNTGSTSTTRSSAMSKVSDQAHLESISKRCEKPALLRLCLRQGERLPANPRPQSRLLGRYRRGPLARYRGSILMTSREAFSTLAPSS